MKTFYLLFLLPALTLCLPVRAQDAAKENKTTKLEAAFRQTRELVESNQFKIEIDRVYPQSGHDVSRFNPRGTITITDSLAKGQLPFFGRAYSLPYGEGGGIIFDAPMKNLSVSIKEKKKKKAIIYQFSVPGDNDLYQVTINITPSGACTLNLTSNNRAHISYSGTIVPLEEK